MRITLFVCLFIIGGLTAPAQKITYDQPPNLPQKVSIADYRFIVDSSVAIVKTRYKVAFVKGGTIFVLIGKDTASVNLDNLVLKCLAEQDRSVWNTVIRGHFSNLFVSIDAQNQLDPKNYETVKKSLSLRIYPKETVDARGGPEQLVARTDMDGTYTLLMLDLPGAFTPVQKKMFDGWNKDQAEVFRAAQENVDTQKMEKTTQSFDFQGSHVEITIIGNENYAASYALNLMNNSPELVGEWGCVVSMPNKALVNLCKISREKPLDFVKFIQMTLPFNEKAYRDHPQPISDHYFWYYKGTFTLIAVMTDDKGGVQVVAPVALGELMSKKQ